MVLLPRIIPCLLLERGRLVKTVQFKNPVYLGDPLHIIRILQELGAHEIIVLDRSARHEGIEYRLLKRIAKECAVPLTYGGGVHTADDAEHLLSLGIEKISFNTAGFDVMKEAAARAGSQSIVASIDVHHGTVVRAGGTQHVSGSVTAYAHDAQTHGAGEILLTSVERDGCMNGYDLELIRSVADTVTIPVVACGGAAHEDDLRSALHAGAAAAAAGSMFVFEGRYRAVLPSFPQLTHV